jgi:fructose-1,6-bisphosphatase I
MLYPITTIERHILEQQRQFPEATGELTGLLQDIAFAAKIVSREVNKAGLINILGLTGEINVQGEEVMKLDRYAQETFFNALDHTGYLCVMASEEEADVIHIPERYPAGKYVMNYDPLDGSSNIDVNVSIGTIFSIHQKKSKHPRGLASDCIQKGRDQIAAGYIIYGSSTMMVYTTGHGVHGFTLDPSVGEFLLSHPDIKIPKRGKIYSCNEGNYRYWSDGVKKYIKYLQEEDPETRRPYTGRYIGSLVADFHRNLLKGGIFMYPADNKDPKKNKGKLRYLYECAPLAFVVEQAGGYASDGKRNILDVEPVELHQRIALFVGSIEDVKDVERFIAEFDHKPEHSAKK